jgi:tRNA(Ile)-lysidine synthase
LGLAAPRLAEVAHHLAEARQALDALADDWAARCLTEQAGTVLIAPLLWRVPLETQRRLIQRILLWIAPAAYAPRGAQLGQLLAALTAGRAATLAGCRFVTDRSGLRALREVKAASPRVRGNLWDGRWRMLGHISETTELGALGAEGLAQVPDWRKTGLPRAALLASPAIWAENRLIAAPLAGFGPPSYSAVPLEPLLARNSVALSH